MIELQGFSWDEIESIEFVGEEECYDITLLESDVYVNEPNFVANDFLVHNCGMHEVYVKRKKGLDPEYNPETQHSILQRILGRTYGVMAYQEQIMQILHAVGDIPLKDCEAVRKAISKKKLEKFIGYKAKFVERGQVNLGWTQEQVEELWSQIEAFSEYGFNKCVTIDTLIPFNDNGVRRFKKIQDFVGDEEVYAIDEMGQTILTKVIALHDHELQEGYEVTFDDGTNVTCTLDHKFLTEEGQQPLWRILNYGLKVLSECSDETIYAQSKTINSTLRESASIKFEKNETSIKLRTMSRFGMENSGRRDSNSTSFPMWNAIPIKNFGGYSSQRMQSLCKNQIGKYQKEKFENQSIRIAKNSGIENGEKNFVTPGNTSKKSRAIKKVAGRKSRKVRQIYGNNGQKSKKLQNGNLVASPITMGAFVYSLRRKATNGGLGQREYLDRSRRILSFLPTSRNSKRKDFAGVSTTAGCDVKPRGNFSEKCHASENEHAMLCKFNGRHEVGMVGLDAGHAPIADTGRLVCRGIVRVVPVGERQMYDLEVACPTHNFLLKNGVVTSNSHSVAYTYISSRLLWLKAHYPIEFYAATLTCEGTIEKIQEYKRDAKSFGRKIQVVPVDINISKESFHIEGDRIYYGIADIKGIGDNVAKRIVAHQPYRDLQDFLEKFGTDSSVCTPLIELGCFGMDIKRKKNYYELFKKHLVKENQRKQRYVKSFAKQQLEILTAAGDPSMDFDFSGDWQERLLLIARERGIDETILAKPIKKYLEGITKHEKKTKDAEDFPSLQYYEIGDIEKPDEMYSEREKAILLANAESEHYGFRWVHPVELCEDHIPGMTFQNMKKFPDADRGFYVEGLVLDVVEKPFKKTAEAREKKFKELEAALSPLRAKFSGTDPEMLKRQLLEVALEIPKEKQMGVYNAFQEYLKCLEETKKAVFYSVKLEDSNSEVASVNIWQNDWERFSELLTMWENPYGKKIGNIIRIRLTPPTNGFPTYGLQTWARHEYARMAPPKDSDLRVTILEHAEKWTQW